ncbi:hypothetical protein SDC9_152703 [bioreactor metagenome]|uniref:Uncharacterized protein n=1 Tax=bioreactor metagenome TaxID=1076179 RepID=A0A645EY91_9ZZZZ
MGQDTGGACPVGEKLAAVFLSRQPQADGVLFQRDRAVTHDPIKAQSRDVQHLFWRQPVAFAIAGRVGIGQPALAVPIHLHPVRHEGIKTGNLVPACANDLAVGVTPQEQVGQHRFPQDEGGHLTVRLIVQDPVEGVICRLGAASVRSFVYVKRQAGDGFRDHTYTGIYSGNLDGRLDADRFAGAAWTKEDGRGGADRVGGFISCFE